MRRISSVVGISTPVRASTGRAVLADGVVERNILGDVAAANGIFQKSLQRNEDFFGLSARQIREQSVAKGIDTRRRQLREFFAAEARIDVVLHVSAVLIQGRAFAALELYIGEPILGRFGDREAFIMRRVHALAHVHLDRGVIGVGP